MPILHVTESVIHACWRALDFFRGQIKENRVAWGETPDAQLDPWTTAQILTILPHRTNEEMIQQGVRWLLGNQKANGSWASTAHPGGGHIPATACCVLALLGPLGIHDQHVIQASGWIIEHYYRGWTTLPESADRQFKDIHYYSTSYALRALAACSHTPEVTLRLQEGIDLLLDVQSESGAWGFSRNRAVDPTFTCYVLHGLLDINDKGRILIPIEALTKGRDWLIKHVNADGSWSAWQGISSSPEATGYALYVLLRLGVPVNHPVIYRAIEFLLVSQSPATGGWCYEDTQTTTDNNWVTYSVLLGLRATLISCGLLDIVDEGLIYTLSELPNEALLTPLDHSFDHQIFDNIPRLVSGPTADTHSLSDSDLKRLLYSNPLRISLSSIPYTRPLDHTMFDAVDQYVAQKLPQEALKEALVHGRQLEIHGVYPAHLLDIGGTLGLSEISEISFTHKTSNSPYNTERPQYFRAFRDGKEIIVIAVVPGRDYVLHYASLIRHFALQYTSAANRRLTVFRYPFAEQSLPEWTQLDSTLVTPGDRVILGHVTSINAELSDCFVSAGAEMSTYYGSHRFKLPDGTRLNLLGVKFCFWGSIAEVLVSALCRLGVSEIIYIAKLGALTGPNDLYNRIFCPKRYVVMNYKDIVSDVSNVPSGIGAMFNNLQIGCHVSVPTVLEEDYEQREMMTNVDALSIDNEISQMARAVDRFNVISSSSVSFTALHFATDYVRESNAKDLITPFDLRNNRSDAARSGKMMMIKKICQEIVVPYLGGKYDEA